MLFVLVFAAAAAVSSTEIMLNSERVERALVGDEEVDAGVTFMTEVVTASPGTQVGMTWYDYQHNGSSNKMKVVEPFDGTGRPFEHMCWTNGLDLGATQRQIYYNFRRRNGTYKWPGVGTQVGSPYYSGYTKMCVLSDGRGAVAMHQRRVSGGEYHAAVGIDVAAGFGTFIMHSIDTLSYPGDPGQPIWPSIARDNMDYLHVVSTHQVVTAGDPHEVYYSRSTDGGLNWQNWAVVDTTWTISYTVAASRHSGTVAYAYCHPRVLTPPPLSYQLNADIYYRMSFDNGANWGAIQNATQFQMADSMRAYCDVDVLFDEGDSLHFVFTGYHASGDSAYFPYQSAIYHWSQAAGLTKIAPAFGWYPYSLDPGGWRFAADRPAIAIDPYTGFLYCVWVVCDEGDVSMLGWPNGELYASYSTDNGRTWSTPINLTNSPTPNAAPGDCDDDDYPSMAGVVDDSLAIIYINDKDAGGMPQNEGTWTENPVMNLNVHTCEFTGLGADLFPHNAPIVIPAQGGSFTFTARVKNCTGSSQTFKAWLMARLPNGNEYGPVEGPIQLTFPAGHQVTVTRTLNVPQGAPAGDYLIRLYLGPYPGWVDRDAFPLTKLP
ncbi:hypothetical protein AMJ71_01740 [candidate division TA06 bacterium SM1_40]|nr:MAG: hypothetical protein AMJ71_01740 [candidate division TA06 bacterium SM1_40]